jgi:hypothetical protein
VQGHVTVKDLSSGTQEVLKRSEVLKAVMQILSTQSRNVPICAK